ncbi:MAG: hypothetical protein OHK0023_26090 [Anaerolineae bacterium]
MPSVVIAYEGFGGIDIERQTLGQMNVDIIHSKRLDTSEAQAAILQADALMVTIQKVPADLIARMQRCKIISRVGTGLDAIDIPAATQHGIWVTNVPDYSIDEVSTHVVALMLSHTRRLPVLAEMIRQTGWYSAALDRPVTRLGLLTFGVIGFGRIGAAAAKKALGLGMRVVVYDPYVPHEQIQRLGGEAVSLERLLHSADYISLHLPLTPETAKIINHETLSLMKPTAYLINTSRGGLIDEAALLEAIQSKRLAGAALDVLTVEPPAPDHPFLQESRITLTPHNAWYSEEAKQDVCRLGAEEVVRVLRGERPRNPANAL